MKNFIHWNCYVQFWGKYFLKFSLNKQNSSFFRFKTSWFLRSFIIIIIGLSHRQSLEAVSNPHTTGRVQLVNVIGVVSSENNNPLGGVVVSSKGTDTQVLTDEVGNYAISVNSNGTLVFTMQGYIIKEEPIAGRTQISVKLTSESGIKDKKYVYVYGDIQKQAELSGAISQINGNQVENNPIINNRNRIQGLLPGLFVMQNNGEPGDEGAALWLRGKRTFRSNEPIVLVDGYERSMDLLDPYEIESVTVLKDAASTSQYGLRSGNGLILVTTKRGQEGNIRISFNAQAGIKAPTTTPKLLNSAQYAALYNEALVNDGKPPLYSDATISKYENVSKGIYEDPLDPYLYPNINWYDTYMKPYTWQQKYNLNFDGGNKFAKYYVSVGYTDNSGLYNVDKNVNTYNTNTYMNMFNIRSNVDINVTKHFSMSLDLAGRQEQRNYPGSRTDASLRVFRSLYKTPPNAHSIHTPDGYIAGTKDYNQNPYGLLNYQGYSLYYVRSMYATLRAKHDLDFITKGLSLNGSVAFDSWFDQNTNRSKSFKVYDLRQADGSVVYNADGTIKYVQTGSDTQMSSSVDYPSTRRILDADLSLDFARTFGMHAIRGNVAFSQRSIFQEDNTDIPRAYRGLNGKLSYVLHDRYLAEFDFGYQGSEQMPVGHKYGFFPAASVGWIISEENFLKENQWINFLKIRGSHGLTGNDDLGSYFAWFQKFQSSGGTNFGYTSLGYSGWQETAFALNNVTWERVLKSDVGIDATFIKNKIDLSFDYFYEHNSDIMIQPSLPYIMGIRFPSFPIGIIENKGFDLSLNYSDKIGSVQYSIGGIFSKAENKVLARGEEKQKYSYQQRTGLPLDPVFGLEAIGLFRDQPEIDASPVQTFGTVRPGDIKYKDQNNDGVIDSYDQVYLGQSADPVYQYGVNSEIKYKGFDFNVLFTGQGGGGLNLTGEAIWEFHDNGTVREHHLGRFNPADESTWDNATYPRLSLSNKANNQPISTYWRKDATMLRLKSAEIGYTLPSSLSQKIRINKLRIFVNGYNLYTWSSTNLVDIEARSSHYVVYPIQRLINTGINVTF